MWLHRELRDGTYDFADLCEVHALLDWKDEVLRQPEK
jgi:hypothetical protein